jgi:DNA-binding CsgD family transcriptional regulator
VARSLREHGVRVRRPGAGRPSYGAQLSPRELEVVRLLAVGKTNREIARVLFLSPRTVAHHVESAMRKLHATTRAAVVVAAIEADLMPIKPADQPGG